VETLFTIVNPDAPLKHSQVTNNMKTPCTIAFIELLSIFLSKLWS